MSDTCLTWEELQNSVGPCLRPGGTALTARALAICELPAGSVVADIGCGAGETLAYLERTGLYTLAGIDVSEQLLAAAADRLETTRLVRGRAEALPLADDSLDLLLCECVLSTLDDRQAALAEFVRVLKAGGSLVISDLFRKGDAGRDGDADGLLTREFLLDILAGHGFDLLLWETHDRLLREFAVRMILAGKPLPDAWGCGRGGTGEKRGGAGLSYFLLVARKAG